MHTSTNYFLFSLALADLTILLMGEFLAFLLQANCNMLIFSGQHILCKLCSFELFVREKNYL